MTQPTTAGQFVRTPGGYIGITLSPSYRTGVILVAVAGLKFHVNRIDSYYRLDELTVIEVEEKEA